MVILLVIVGIVLFQLLVVLHEYGHFLVARRNGVEVEEFGLGFPPKIVGKTMGKGIFRAYYTLNWLPLGGFVKLKGENDMAEGKDTYGGSSLKVKTKIILAGVAINYLIAVVLFTFLAAVGVPKLLPIEPITSEEQFTIASDTKIIESKAYYIGSFENSPSFDIGMKEGDEVVRIGEVAIINSDDIADTTPTYAGQTVDVEVIRDDKRIVFPVNVTEQSVVESTVAQRETCLQLNESASTNTITDCPDVVPYTGIVTQDVVLQRSTWSAPITGVGLSVQYTKVTFQGLWRALSSLVTGDTQTAQDSVAGPVGVFFVIKQSANYGFRFVLMLIATISLTLAIMNSLPIPALDGGRLMLTVLFRKVLRKPLTKSLEEKIVGSSMVGLLGLMALITVVDVKRFF